MNNKGIIPELLLDCLGGTMLDKLAEKISGVSADQWNDFVHQARRHDIAPLLFFKLKSLAHESAVPPQTIHQLHVASLQSAARNILIYEELKKILEILFNEGIPVILLKGSYLAAEVYQDIALRPMCDLDILLKKEDLEKGENVLKAIGYSTRRPYLPEVDSVMHQHILPFTKVNAVPVEVHWNIFDPEVPFNPDVDGLWQRAKPCAVAGVETKTLCLEDLLLHLSIHGTYHHCFDMGLIKLYDIDLLLRRHGDTIDWKGLFKRAEEWGFDRCLLLTLRIVVDLFGTYLPRDVASVVQNAEFGPEVLSLAADQLFQERKDTILSPTMTDLVEKKGMFKKTVFLTSRLFPSKKEIARMYPVSPLSPKIYMYYPVRVKDLLYRYGKGFWKVIQGNKSALHTLSQKQKKAKLKMWMRKEMYVEDSCSG